MKAIILSRVSTKEQEEGFSIDSQKNRLMDYCNKKGFEVIKCFEIIESSTRGDRKKFLEAINYVKSQKEIIAIVADAVDRIQRSFKESIMLSELMDKDKIELHFLRENLILNRQSQSNDGMRWDFATMMAKAYISSLRDNVKRSIEYKLKSGEWPGKAPIGYLNVDKENGKKDIVPDPNRASYIIRAYELYGSGNSSMSSIYKILKTEGLTNNTKLGRSIVKSQVEHILKNPFYYGEMRYDNKLIKHGYKPLISKNLFDKVQYVKASYHKKPFKYNTKPFLFRGLIKCYHCNYLITPEIKKNKYTYYHCTKYGGNCEGVWVREEELLVQIKSALESLKIPEEILTWLTSEICNFQNENSEFAIINLKNLKDEFDKIEKSFEIMYSDRIDGRISVDFYDKKVKELKNKQEELKGLINNYQQNLKICQVDTHKIFDLANKAWDIFKSSKVEQQRGLLNFLLQNCKLKEKNLIFELKKPFDVISQCSKTQSWLPG